MLLGYQLVISVISFSEEEKKRQVAQVKQLEFACRPGIQVTISYQVLRLSGSRRKRS
jgi:hypothetical protein